MPIKLSISEKKKKKKKKKKNMYKQSDSDFRTYLETNFKRFLSDCFIILHEQKKKKNWWGSMTY